MQKTEEEKIKREIYFVIGPTSSGKTKTSIDLAKKLKGENINSEIICCDSRQIFRELNISSGKISKEEMENIPHHLLDVVNPGEYFTVIDYVKLTQDKIEEIYSRGNIPIISGGTGFYIDALLYEYNLPELPKNEILRKELENKNILELQEILQKYIEKQSQQKNDNKNNYLEKFKEKEFYNNKNRVMRAIELIEHFGYIPEITKKERFTKDKYNLHFIITQVDKKTLKDKIYKRTMERLNAGVLTEFENIVKKYNLSEKYIKAWGYEFSLMWEFINKKIDEKTFLENFVNKEYQYAKRQITWFKRYTTF